MLDRMSSVICSGSQRLTVKGIVSSIAQQRPWKCLWRKTAVLKVTIDHPGLPLKHLNVFDNGRTLVSKRVGSVLNVTLARANEYEQHYFGTEPLKVIDVV